MVISVLHKLHIRWDEVSIHFVTNRKLCKLHEEFFNDPSPTDCISFPIDGDGKSDYRVLGEVFVCPKTAIEYAKKKQKDPYAETTLYVVHGLLHLLGYDDIHPKDRALMRRKERECMEHLRQEDLLLTKKKIV